MSSCVSPIPSLPSSLARFFSLKNEIVQRFKKRLPFPLYKLTGTHQDFLESVVHPRNEKNAQLWHEKFHHCCVLCLRLRKLKIEGDDR